MENSMNKLDKKYLKLLIKILDKGVKKQDRTGTGTISIFGERIRHNMSEGFPLLTSKQVHTKSVLVELFWFLGKHMLDSRYARLGRTNIKYLVDNQCFIWVGDAYKAYVNKIEAMRSKYSKVKGQLKIELKDVDSAII